MFAQKLAEAFDLTNRRLVYWFIFSLMGLPIVGMVGAAGNFGDPSAFSPAAVLKILGFLILYGLFALFVWPYVYGGMIGELAHCAEGPTDWGAFKSWGGRSYGKLLLFNIVILVLALFVLFLFGLIVAIGFLARGLSSPEEVAALQGRFSGPERSTGWGTFLGEVASTGLGEALVIILASAMVALVLSERGVWRSLGAGFKIFFTGAVFRFFLLVFLIFLFLNLLGVLVFNRPGARGSFSLLYFTVLIILQGYFSVFAVSFLVPFFKPKEQTEVWVAPTG